MLATPPPAAEEPSAVVFAHVSADPPRASVQHSALPPTVDDIIARALAKQPTQRFPDCTTFIQALRTPSNGVVTASPPRPGFTPPIPPVPDTVAWPPAIRHDQQKPTQGDDRTTGEPVSLMTNPRNHLEQAITLVLVFVAVLAIVAIGAVVLSQITGPTTTTIPLDIPSGVAITPDGRHAYVATVDGASVIDTASNTVTTTIPLDHSHRVAIIPDGRHAYIDGITSVAVIDTITNTVTTTIPLPDDQVARELAIAPDGRHAYIAASTQTRGNNRMLVVDTTSNRITSTIPLPGAGSPDAITVDGGHVYLVIDGKVVVVDTTSNTITSPFPVSFAHGLAITPDGRHAYVPELVDVSVIDTSTNSITTTITGFRSPEAPAITADGRHVYIIDNVADNVSAVDTNSNRITSTIPLPHDFYPREVAISSDGRHVCLRGLKGVFMIKVGE